MNNHVQSDFVTSFNFEMHPLRKAKKKIRLQYYAVLEYLVTKCDGTKDYITARLCQYHTMLVGNEAKIEWNEGNSDNIIRPIINEWLKTWIWKYRFLLICDMAIIVIDQKMIEKSYEIIRSFLSKRQSIALNVLVSLFNNDEISGKLLFAEDLIHQFRINRRFARQPEKRILITANMSAGKSTLINAIIGKRVVRTAQEACTAKLSYVFNKPLEDDSIHLRTPKLKLNITYHDLINKESSNGSQIASYFRLFTHSVSPIRLCLIDTPGVNSAINMDHGKRTRYALLHEQYDKLIYVLNANQLGTDDEIRYLKYISEHVPKHKIIFVLNKVDTFKSTDDSITASIKRVQNDLIQLGFEHPIIYPVSAYFALLLKMKQHNEFMTEDEQDEYDYYVKKFSRPEFDLSRYVHPSITSAQTEDEQSQLARKCGLSGLENILQGGKTNEKSIGEI